MGWKLGSQQGNSRLDGEDYEFVIVKVAVVFDPCSSYSDPEFEGGIQNMFGGFGAPYTRGYDRVSKRRVNPVYAFYYRNCESGSLDVMEYFPFLVKTDSSLPLAFPSSFLQILPPRRGWNDRRFLYLLYHNLNHW